MDEKTIRFIDSRYNELFAIPDGGSIVVTRPDGEQWIGVCKYLDAAHLSVNGECYHICQFAEVQERIGATVAPEAEPEMVGGHYRIMNRIPVGDKVYVLGHSPNAPAPYATWQAYRDKPGFDWGHYWSNKSDAWGDLLCRADAERTGRHYDHTKRYQQSGRDGVTQEEGAGDDMRVTPADGLPEGWNWHCHVDGSGCLKSPDGKRFVRYDLATSECNFGDGWSRLGQNFPAFQKSVVDRVCIELARAKASTNHTKRHQQKERGDAR